MRVLRLKCSVTLRQCSHALCNRVIERAVSNAFLAADEEFLMTSSKPSSGSTATTVMILGDRLYSFNVGDSRTILCRSGRAELVSKVYRIGGKGGAVRDDGRDSRESGGMRGFRAPVL